MLSAAERQIVVDQALALIEHLYVHLPLKRAMHAVDPLQRLRLLKRHSATLSEGAFHAELISIFNARPQRTLDVTDGTTSIELPPFAGGSGDSATIELRGFRNDQLVASTRVRL